MLPAPADDELRTIARLVSLAIQIESAPSVRLWPVASRARLLTPKSRMSVGAQKYAAAERLSTGSLVLNTSGL